MNNLIKKFEGQEIKVKTDNGQTLINLVATAKVCGLTNKTRGFESVRWSQVKDRLSIINTIGEGMPTQYLEELNFVLEEIENADDRNSIYMSSWLSKRLALECHSEKANRYKNFLVSLDEARENKAVAINNLDPELLLNMTQGMQFATVAIKSMQESMMFITEYVKDSINSKDLQIDKAMNLIGIRSVNVKHLSDKLKEKLTNELGTKITASNCIYVKIKNQIFKEFNVLKWEDISAMKYSSVFAFIDGLEKWELI